MDCKYVLKIKIPRLDNAEFIYDARPIVTRLTKMGITRYRMRFPRTHEISKYDEDFNLIVPIYFESQKDLLACKMICET